MPTSSAELAIIVELQDRASAQLRQIGQSVERLERQTEGVQRRSGGGLLGGLQLGAGIAAAQQAFGALGGIIDFVRESIFGLNADLERSVTTFTALTGSAARAREIIGALRREAAATPFSDAEIIAAGRALISASDGSAESLLGLVRVAEQLAAIDPAQGLEGAAMAVREALGGDFESLIQRFEVSRQAIARFRAEGLSNLQIVTRALQEMGVTSELVERLGRTFEGRRGTVVSFFDEFRRSLGEGIFQRVSDLFGHMVNLIADHGARLLQVASDIGQALGAFLERIAGAATGPLRALLDAFAPGLWGVIAAELERTVEPVQEIERAATQAAPAVQSLERQLAGIGVAAAGLQIEADSVRRGYEEQLQPLERQLRLLQQSADLQRVQNALATNRGAVERLRLEREILALRQAAGGQTDPNAEGLTLRQRLIALALQERELRQEELGLEEERRPLVQSLQQRIAAIQEEQRRALAPLEAQLQNYRDQAAALQLVRQQAELVKQDSERAAAAIRAAGTGPAAPEALADSKARGEALADQWLQGWREWIERGGGTIGGALQKSLNDWWEATGRPSAVALGAELGAVMAEAAASAFGQRFRQEVEQRVAGSSAAQIADAVSRSTFASPAPAQASGGGGSAFTGEGMTVNVDVSGASDPGLVERFRSQLQAQLDQFIRSFFAAEAATDPGAPRTVQGAGR